MPQIQESAHCTNQPGNDQYNDQTISWTTVPHITTPPDMVSFFAIGGIFLFFLVANKIHEVG
jgi:hypothetical protein